MKIWGRNLLDREQQTAIPFDEIVFEVDGREIVISVYQARTNGRIRMEIQLETLRAATIEECLSELQCILTSADLDRVRGPLRALKEQK